MNAEKAPFLLVDLAISRADANDFNLISTPS